MTPNGHRWAKIGPNGRLKVVRMAREGYSWTEISNATNYAPQGIARVVKTELPADMYEELRFSQLETREYRLRRMREIRDGKELTAVPPSPYAPPEGRKEQFNAIAAFSAEYERVKQALADSGLVVSGTVQITVNVPI